MKRLRMLLAMLLLMAAGTGHAEERISVPSINVEPGTQAEIVVSCEFSNENMTLYQFDLYLPEGFTPAYDADEEDWVYTLSSRHKKSHQFAMTDNGSFYRVVVSSNTNKLIASGTGELLRITVDVAETVTGTHRATIKQFSMFETDETEHPMADYSFNLVAPSAVIHVEDISVNPTSITLTPENNTVQLSATVTPGNATDKSVRWESNNTPVATVDDNGLVTAISTGTAIVTAHTNDGNFAASCTVTVDFPPAKEYISVADVNVEPGSRAEIAIDCEFANNNMTLYQFDLYLPEGFTPAYDAAEEDWVYTLSSRHKKSHQFAMTDNGSFYRVVVSSNTNKLIAPGSGELLRITVDVAEAVTGTLQAAIKNFSMFETDETEHPMADYSFNLVASSAVIHVEDISVNPTSVTLTPENNTAQLSATVTPGNATDKSVRWESNNTPVATVDENGLVTAISTGTAIVTAHTNDGNFAASCTVTVNIPIEDQPNVQGKSFTLRCARGYVYGDGTKLAGTTDASQASEFAIVTYNGQTYLYDATNKAFVVHTTAAKAGTTGNPSLESKDDFSKAVTGLTWGATGYEAYPYYLEDSFGNWMNMDKKPKVYMNTWKDFEGGNGGNTYAVTIVDTEFDATEAIEMLDAYYNPEATVTYVISDENGVVFTSDPQPSSKGTVITEFPVALKREYCEYSMTPTTLNTGENTIEVSVRYNLPFKVSTSFSKAVWYYATIRGTKYLRANEDNKDAKGRYTTSTSNERTAAYRWAFFGNPYTYFYIANEGSGEGKYLFAGEAPTMQSVDNPTGTDAALWALSVNGDGFSLRSITGASLYINDNSGSGNLGYWNNVSGATDAGSRWMIEEVLADGIQEMNSGEWRAESGEWGGVYDLSGRHLNNVQLRKGVYIINGRKMLVK